MACKNPMTVDEIVAALRHSSLPCLLVEGSDDMSLFRRICEKQGVDPFPCGGRKNLLSVYERRSEFGRAAVVFFADKDIWALDDDGVPDEYKGVIFTHGYSIENDVLAGSKVFKLHSKTGLALYDDMKHELSVWWAFENSERRHGKDFVFDRKVQSLLPGLSSKNPIARLDRASLVAERGFAEPSSDYVDWIERNFELVFRGHQLLDMHRCLLCLEPDTRPVAAGLLVTVFCMGGSPYIEDDLRRIEEGFKSFAAD